MTKDPPPKKKKKKKCIGREKVSGDSIMYYPTVKCISADNMYQRTKDIISTWQKSNNYLKRPRPDYLFRIVRAEWSQCRRCQALGSWVSGKLERVEQLGEGWGK
jgi:hypothetical protein